MAVMVSSQNDNYILYLHVVEDIGLQLIEGLMCLDYINVGVLILC